MIFIKQKFNNKKNPFIISFYNSYYKNKKNVIQIAANLKNICNVKLPEIKQSFVKKINVCFSNKTLKQYKIPNIPYNRSTTSLCLNKSFITLSYRSYPRNIRPKSSNSTDSESKNKPKSPLDNITPLKPPLKQSDIPPITDVVKSSTNPKPIEKPSSSTTQNKEPTPQYKPYEKPKDIKSILDKIPTAAKDVVVTEQHKDNIFLSKDQPLQENKKQMLCVLDKPFIANVQDISTLSSDVQKDFEQYLKRDDIISKIKKTFTSIVIPKIKENPELTFYDGVGVTKEDIYYVLQKKEQENLESVEKHFLIYLQKKKQNIDTTLWLKGTQSVVSIAIYEQLIEKIEKHEKNN